MLENTQGACVITHRHADLDAYACGAAVKELMEQMNIRSRLVVPEDVSVEVKNYMNRLGIKPMHVDSCDEAELAVLVDISTYSQINELVKYVEEKKVLVIDHHAVHNINSTLSIVDKNATSCSEIISIIYRGFGMTPSKDIALLLLGGIISDSNRFARARSETFDIVHWLLSIAGANYGDIVSALSTELSFSEKMARIKGILRLRAYRLGETVVCLSRVSAYESSLADLMLRAGCDIALVASDHNNEVRLIGRSTRKVSISLAEVFSEVARYFGGEGGGHDAAAALSIKSSVDLWTVLIKTLNAIESKLGVKAQRILEST